MMTEAALEHARLQELVAAFADGELPPDTARLVQEHLRTCARCRRELALQQELARALSWEPGGRPSDDLRRRIEQIGQPRPLREPFRWNTRWMAAAAAALVAIGASVGTLLRERRGSLDRPVAQIPMFRDAIADCHRAMARNFPRKADLQAVGEGLQFPIPTLDQPDAELFSTWKTTLAGSPAAGLAYHWRGIVVVQYVVPTELIRRPPEVRQALRGSGFFAASEQGQGILAFLAHGSGTLLVANAPPEELKRLM
jgi:Putative zinc-finger